MQRARRDQSFDIGAIALAAVAIGDEAQVGIFVPVIDQSGQHVPRDFDLTGAVDLSPHGPRRIIDDHDVVRSMRGCRAGHAADQCHLGQSQCAQFHFPVLLLTIA
ncbi:MAG TPA: hypothetical protein DEA72_09270 [Halomonas campaniensis]|nr:hypothetical protein [Halomonas campaniensis]